ncbi:MAG: BrnA antitoxin family protein [Formosimonas sp.]
MLFEQSFFIGQHQIHAAAEISARAKITTTIRLDEDLLEALRASGSGWQTRVNDELRAAFRLAGKL